MEWVPFSPDTFFSGAYVDFFQNVAAETAQVLLGHCQFYFSCVWAELGLLSALGIALRIAQITVQVTGWSKTLILTRQASFHWLLCNYNWSPLFWSCIVWNTQTVSSITPPVTGYTNVSLRTAHLMLYAHLHSDLDLSFECVHELMFVKSCSLIKIITLRMILESVLIWQTVQVWLSDNLASTIF